MRTVGRIVALSTLVSVGAATGATADWRPPTALTRPGVSAGSSPALAPLPRGALTAYASGVDGRSARLSVDTLAPDGSRVAHEDVGEPARAVFPVGVATDPRGAAVVAWLAEDFSDRRGRTGRIWVATRAPGGRFGAPTAVSSPTARGAAVPEQAAVTLDPAGRIVVAWERVVGRQRRVQVAQRTPAGRWLAVRNLSPPDQRAIFPRLASAADGTVLVAWSTSTGGVVRLRRPGRGFGTATALPGTFVTDLALAGDGSGLVVGQTGIERPVVAMPVARDGALGDAQTVSIVPGANRPRVGMDDAGDAVIVWERRIPDPELTHGSIYAVEAASRSGSAPFGAPDTISPRSFSRAVSPGPQVTVGPDARAAVVFGDREGVAAAVRGPGPSFGAPTRLEPADGDRIRVDFGWTTTIDGAGTAIAAWPRVVRSSFTQIVADGTG